MLSARRLLLAVTVAAAVAPLAATPATADFTPSAYADATISTTSVTVPMVFPVIGPTSYSDTFLACRSGCTRKHFGQDLMGPKMRKAVAAFNGVVWNIKRESYVGEGNYITIKGDNGWSVNYIHMNNDTPGTDDGKGTANYFLAPGITEGSRVFAGQFIGYSGDSGNAESTGPHVHFELRKGDPWSGTVYNAFASLNAARRISVPTTSGPHPEGLVVRGCSTCAWWQLTGGKRHQLLPEVAKELAVDPRTVVTISQTEARWYHAGAAVQLPGGRAYKAADGKTWFVTGGVRYAIPSADALAALGIATARVRTATDAALKTVPVAPAGSVLPVGLTYGGALLRVPGSTTSYWYLKSGQRHLVSDATTLKSWGLAYADAITLPAEYDLLTLPALGAPMVMRDGTMVKDSAGRRFLVTGGVRRAFISWTAYTMYGYTNVLQQAVPAAVLSRLTVGPRLP